MEGGARDAARDVVEGDKERLDEGGKGAAIFVFFIAFTDYLVVVTFFIVSAAAAAAGRG